MAYLKKNLFCLLVTVLSSLVAYGQDNPKVDRLCDKGDEYLYSDDNADSSTKNLHKAIDFYNKALAIDANNYRALCNRGIAYRYLGKSEDASKDLNRAIDLHPELYYAYYHKSLLLRDDGLYEQALENALSTYTGDPDIDLFTLRNIGDLYDELGAYDSAYQYFSMALDLKPKTVDILLLRSITSLKSGWYDRTITDCNKILSFDASVLSAYNQRGQAYHHLEQYDQAIANFKKAISIMSKNKSASLDSVKTSYCHNNLANSYFAKAETEKACTHWQKALDFGYTYEPEFLKLYKIEDPQVLMDKNCKSDQ